MLGRGLGCFGLTEPDSGSDAASLRTRAERIDGGWRINGNKMWISLGNYADVALIFAQTDPEKAHRGLACFLVPTDSEGFSSQEIHGKLGLRASDTASISLDGIEVGDDALLGEVGDGFKIAMSRARLRAATRSPRAASGSATAASTPRSPTRPSASSSACRSPASSSSRS